MKTSSRNQFEGIIKDIERHEVNGIVTIDVNGLEFHSITSLTSIDNLGLKVGDKAKAVIKSAQILLENNVHEIGTKNIFKGEITNIEKGKVTINASGDKVSAIITQTQVANMGLEIGKNIYIIVKATSVLVGEENLNMTCASNHFKAEIVDIKKGSVISYITMKTSNGNTITSELANTASDELKLSVGSKVTVFFKALSALVAIE